jgi:hypothetical protein
MKIGRPQETQHETGRKTHRRNTPTIVESSRNSLSLSESESVTTEKIEG